jgi:hypothetical protein
MHEYEGASSDDDEYDGHNQNEYSSEDDEDDDDEDNDQSHPIKHDHQLEWDDAAIEYGPKKV